MSIIIETSMNFCSNCGSAELVKKSKFYPHAGKNEVELHGKIVFTKAFDEVRNKRVNLKKYEYDYKGWPKHVKEFIGNMEMFK